MTKEQVLDIHRTNKPKELLLIGGEPMILGPDYYYWLLENDVNFSMQTNLTLYTKDWDKVFSHLNFSGLSVSGDKFNSIDEFIDVFKQVRNLVPITPVVLILMTGENKEQILEKCNMWIDTAVVHDFILKINYIIPTGKTLTAIDKIPKMSLVYDIYELLLTKWKDTGFHAINPFSDLMQALISDESRVCPYIPDCLHSDGVKCIEVDGQTYDCPALGDIRVKREDLTLEYNDKCAMCDLYSLCKSCVNRSWTLTKLPDSDYCGAFKKFFATLSSFKGELLLC